MGHQPAQLRDLQVHPLRERDPGPPGQRRRRRHLDRRRARGSTSTTSTRRAASPCPSPVAGRRAYNAFVQPLIDRYGYVQNGVARGRRHRRLRQPVRRQRLLPRRRPGRLQPHLGTNVAPRPARRLPVLRGRRGPDPQLERLGPDHRPRRPARASRARPIFYTGALPAADRRARCAPIHSEYQSQNFELNDTIKWKNWTFNVGVLPATTRSTARACARTPSTLSGFVARAGQQVRDVRDPVQQDDPAAPGRDLGLQRQGHALRELRALQPGGQLAAARRLLGPQPDRRPHQRLLRPERRALRHRARRLLLGQAVRRGPDAAHGRRVPGRHRAAVQPQLVGARSTAATARAATSGRTPTTTRASPSTRRRASRASCTSRTSPRGWRRSAAARPTSSPSSTAPTRSTTRPRSSPSGGATRRSCAARTPGATTTATSTRTTRPASTTTLNIFIGSSNIATAPAASSGTSRTATCAATAAPAEALRLPRSSRWNATVGRVLRLPVRPAVGDVELRAVPRAHHLDQRHEPLRGAGGLAPHRLALAARPQLHAELPARRPAATSSSRPTCSTCSTSRPATTSSRRSHNSPFGTPRNLLRPAALPAGGAVQF